MKHTTYTDTQSALASEIQKCEKIIASLDIDNAPSELKQGRIDWMKHTHQRLVELRKEASALRANYYGTPDTLTAYRLSQ